jgi:hypothetical protein
MSTKRGWLAISSVRPVSLTLYRRLQQRALYEGRSMRRLVLAALTEYLAREDRRHPIPLEELVLPEDIGTADRRYRSRNAEALERLAAERAAARAVTSQAAAGPTTTDSFRAGPEPSPSADS